MPQRLGALMPKRRLDIELAVAGQARGARMGGDASWNDRIERVRNDVQHT